MKRACSIAVFALLLAVTCLWTSTASAGYGSGYGCGGYPQFPQYPSGNCHSGHCYPTPSYPQYPQYPQYPTGNCHTGHCYPTPSYPQYPQYPTGDCYPAPSYPQYPQAPQYPSGNGGWDTGSGGYGGGN